MAEGGSAEEQEPDPLPARRQSLINEILQAIPPAERFQRDWANGAKNFTPQEAWKAHDLAVRTYAKYPHNLFPQTQGKYRDRTIELWPAGMWVLPRGVTQIKTEVLSQMRVKPNNEFVAVGMVDGRIRLLVSNEKNGTYVDLSDRHMNELLPVNLNSIRCLLEGLAKPPKVAAGEPNWPDEVKNFGK